MEASVTPTPQRAVSLDAYVIAHLWDGFFRNNTTNHLNTFLLWLKGPDTFSNGTAPLRSAG